MRIWRHNWRDSGLLAVALGQVGLVGALAWWWPGLSGGARAAAIAGIAVGHWYNIAIAGHLFVHAPWFASARVNRVAAWLVSLAIGQSVEAYRLSHVRNHHRYSNDRQDAAGSTRDTSSTFRHAPTASHQPLWRYAPAGAIHSIAGELRARGTAIGLWFGGALEPGLGRLLARRPALRQAEFRAVRAERTWLCVAWLCLLALRTSFLPAYVAALTLAFVLVNVQNYFEHYGARPEDNFANSVSHYGRVYNLLTFNDGHHQEHHLRPSCHWRRLPGLRHRHAAEFLTTERVVSPVPAVLGFLHLHRPRLDLPNSVGDEACQPARTA